MGYVTTFFGQIEIEPPLNDAEIEFINSGVLTTKTRILREVHGCDSRSEWTAEPEALWIENSTDDADDEWLRFIVTNLLAPSARGWVDTFVNLYPRLAEFTCDHTLNGEVEAHGEDAPDLWRMSVVDNEVTVERASFFFGVEHDSGALEAIKQIMRRPVRRSGIEDPTLQAIAELLAK